MYRLQNPDHVGRQQGFTVPELMITLGIVAILGGHRQAQEWIAELADDLGKGRALVVCQDLSRPEEKMERVSVEKFRTLSLSTRTIVLIIKEELLA